MITYVISLLMIVCRLTAANPIAFESLLKTYALSLQVKDGSAQIGCFHYSPDDLVFSAEDSADARLTRRLCRNECSSRQFKFFVLYKGSYCYCGLKTFKVGSSQGCTSPCPGDSEETCGGPDALEVYRIVSGENQLTPTLDNAITTEENELLTDTPSPQFQEAVQPSPSPESQEAVQPSPSPESHEAVQPSPSPQSQQSTSLYSGCFHVSRHNSVLSLNIRYDDSMTRTACRTSCSKYHFQYFGIHKGDSCYCGEELRSTTASTSCTIPCPGNASETCGGQDAIEVYKVSS